MNSFQNSLIQKLNRDAAYRTLHSKDKCVIKNAMSSPDAHLGTTCLCSECLLAESILRGQRLSEANKDVRLKKFNKDAITPLVMQAMALAGLSNSVTILFYAVTLSLPFTINHSLSNETIVFQQVQSGFDITKDQIMRAARRPPEIKPVPPKPPILLRPAPPILQ